jgi:hypothetical protein
MPVMSATLNMGFPSLMERAARWRAGLNLGI